MKLKRDLFSFGIFMYDQLPAKLGNHYFNMIRILSFREILKVLSPLLLLKLVN